MIRIYLFIVCSIFASLSLAAQDFPMLHYGVEDGLPSNTVYEIYRDSKGYLWIATDKGVARYNGLSFEIFTTANGLPDNDIFFSQEDKFGRIWFGTSNGELCFYQNGVFHTAANTPYLKLPFKTSYIKYINPEYDGSVTIAFFEQPTFVNICRENMSVLKISRNVGEVIYLDDIRKLAANKYSVEKQINSWDTGALYFRTPDKAKSIRHVAVAVDSSGKRIHFNEEHATVIINDNSKVLSVAKNEGVIYRTCQNIRYKFSGGSIYLPDGTRIGDVPQQLNISATNTLLWLHKDSLNSFISSYEKTILNDSISFLPGKTVSSVVQDNTGNYWVSTTAAGLYRLDRSFFGQRVFNNSYRYKVNYSNATGSHLVYALSNNDLYSFNCGQSKCLFDYEKIKHADYKFSPQPCYLLDSDTFYSFYNDDNYIIGDVFAQKPIIKHYLCAVIHNSVDAIFKINKTLYVQSRKVRILCYDYSNLHEEEEIQHNERYINDPFDTRRIYAMAVAGDQSVWYATLNEVFLVSNGVPVQEKQFKNVTFRNFAFFGQNLVGYTDKNQLVVCRNIRDEKIKIDSFASQGAIWDKMFQIDKDHVLISTNDRYRILNLNDSTVANKLSINILENAIIPTSAESIASDGIKCYFFKDGAISSFSVQTFLEKPPPPVISFTKIKTLRNTIFADSSAFINYYECGNIDLSFSAVSFISKNLTYQYSVSKNGTDNWQDIKGEDINLFQPGYGTFYIKVRAKTLSSEYSQPALFKLIIGRPYWATWWFIALCILLLAGIVALIVRLRIAYIVRKNDKEHQTEVKFMRSEYKALNALMNPHFIFNTLNNVQSLINGDDKRAANEYLRVFADIIRQNMHNVSKDQIPLQKEIDLVTNYLRLEKLRFEDNLNYSINIEDDTDISGTLVPPLLIQPLVENSIKHGILPLQSSSGFVELKIYERGNMLYIEVRDNGVGLSQAKRNAQNALHESFGMENIKKRIEQLSIIQNTKIDLDIRETFDAAGQHEWTIVTIIMAL